VRVSGLVILHFKQFPNFNLYRDVLKLSTCSVFTFASLVIELSVISLFDSVLPFRTRFSDSDQKRDYSSSSS